MNDFEAKRITALLAAAYPSWRPTEATLQLYERILRPLPTPLAERAVLEFIHSPREFAPPAGAICSRVARLAMLPGGATERSAEEAWGELQTAVRIHGAYRPPSFSDRVLQLSVAAMGWSELCTNPNTEATRAHFFRLFENLLEREVARGVEALSAGTAVPHLAAGWSRGSGAPQIERGGN
jgi:hypothetical protein